jgi:hypothetical protein
MFYYINNKIVILIFLRSIKLWKVAEKRKSNRSVTSGFCEKGYPEISEHKDGHCIHLRGFRPAIQEVYGELLE